MSGDVLVLTVPLRDGMRYPSANHSLRTGLAYGAKNDHYRALAHDVEEAAKAAVAAGWEPIAYACRCWITRYVPDARVFDAFNLGQCEANALTRGGVWTDDELARPIVLDVQPKSAGRDRIVIVVQRLAPPVGLAPRAPRPAVVRRGRAAPAAPAAAAVPPTVVWGPGDPIPPNCALLDGRVIPMQEALRLIPGERPSARVPSRSQGKRDR